MGERASNEQTNKWNSLNLFVSEWKSEWSRGSSKAKTNQIQLMKSNWIIDFVFVERSATNQSIKHINQSKTFDWMIEFDWIWLIAAPLAAFNGWFWFVCGRDERQLPQPKQINSFLFTCLVELVYLPNGSIKFKVFIKLVDILIAEINWYYNSTVVDQWIIKLP